MGKEFGRRYRERESYEEGQEEERGREEMEKEV